jgi:cytochrome c553
MTATSRLLMYAVVGLCALPPGAASAKGSPEAAATVANTCLACHGANGNSVNAVWPSLAGQNAAYIQKQLKHYHDATRNGMEKDKNGMLMPPMAAPLTAQQIEDVAAYYSVQTPAGGEANATYWEAGKKLFHGGDKARGIPACAACHGPLGSGNPAAGYPQLRAQHSDYTIKQLNAYHSRTRYTVNAKGGSNGGDNAEIMHAIVDRLSADDIRNLAAYVEGMR